MAGHVGNITGEILSTINSPSPYWLTHQHSSPLAGHSPSVLADRQGCGLHWHLVVVVVAGVGLGSLALFWELPQTWLCLSCLRQTQQLVSCLSDEPRQPQCERIHAVKLCWWKPEQTVGIPTRETPCILNVQTELKMEHQYRTLISAMRWCITCAQIKSLSSQRCPDSPISTHTENRGAQQEPTWMDSLQANTVLTGG